MVCKPGRPHKNADFGTGEFGTKLETDGDKEWLHDLSQWVNNIGPANDGLHNDVTSFFYWCALLHEASHAQSLASAFSDTP